MRSPSTPAASANAFAPKSVLEGVVLFVVMLLVWSIQDALDFWRPYRRKSE